MSSWGRIRNVWTEGNGLEVHVHMGAGFEENRTVRCSNCTQGIATSTMIAASKSAMSRVVIPRHGAKSYRGTGVGFSQDLKQRLVAQTPLKRRDLTPFPKRMIVLLRGALMQTQWIWVALLKSIKCPKS